MENKTIIAEAMTQKAPVSTPKSTEVLELFKRKDTIKAFENVLGDKTSMFIQTARNVLLAPQNSKLRQCSPNSVLKSCMACAVTGLTIDPAFGQAAIVPFGGIATFMPMKNGLIQLANNTGLYSRINAGPVYEGDIKSYNPFTGDYIYNEEPHNRDILVGYMAYLRFLTGGDHYLYMTVEEIKEHGRKYSKTFNRSDSLWNTNFPVMAEKTVIKQILNKWGSIDTMPNSKLWLALKFDQATPTDMDILSAQPEYPDHGESEIINIEAEEI